MNLVTFPNSVTTIACSSILKQNNDSRIKPNVKATVIIRFTIWRINPPSKNRSFKTNCCNECNADRKSVV